MWNKIYENIFSHDSFIIYLLRFFDSYYNLGPKLWFMETNALLEYKNKWSKKVQRGQSF